MTIVKLNLEHPTEVPAGAPEGNIGKVISEIIAGDEAVESELIKLRQLAQDRRAAFTYHAYGKFRGEWTLEDVQHILNWCELYHQALAIWENTGSGIQLFCIKDPDYGHENVGMALYEYMQGHYMSYGLAHWTEWVSWGIEIDTSIPAQHGTRDDTIVLSTTDGQVALLY